MRNLYNIIIMLAFMALAVSCRQDDQIGQEPQECKVNLSVELPGNISSTRSQIAVPATHMLRCIIEVWTQGSSPVLKYRQEVAVEGGSLPTFNFELKPDNYNFLVWADYISRDAATTEVTTEEEVAYTHFEDTYYDTSHLKNITLIEENIGNVFDTDLCDGFYATMLINKSSTAVQQVLKLQRPFAKLIVKEEDAEQFGSLQGMTIECQLPKSFDVETAEPSTETVTATYGKEFQAEDNSQILFTSYLFVPSMGWQMGNLILTFTTEKGKSKCEVPAESITLARNQQLTASGKIMEGGVMEPDPQPTPAGDPQVGDFFFSDGTWSSELTEENKDKCIGIVFAAGAQPGDDISNYPGSDGKAIKGYVMALKNAEVKDFFPSGANDYANNGRPYFYRQSSGNYDADVVNASKAFFKSYAAGWDVYNGFSVTREILASEMYTSHKEEIYFPALNLFDEWKKSAVQAANASEWYIPSAAQLLQFSGGLFGFSGGTAGSVTVPEATKIQAYNDAFMKAIEMGITSHFPANNSNKGYYFYSVSFSSDPVPHSLQIGYGTEGAGSILAVKPSYKVQGYIRPVLTIIQ